MISNISNALPVLLKKIRTKNISGNENGSPIKFDLVETLNFYNSILPKTKSSFGLKHTYLDIVFRLNENRSDLMRSFQLSVDSLAFLKDFEYELHPDDRVIIIRGSCEDFAILSLILIGSIKSLGSDTVRNRGIFISLAMHFLKYCYDSGYKTCELDDIKILEEYNGKFDEEVFESIAIMPTSEHKVGTIHFIGIEMNKDIMKIFETYKNIKFSYNEENASFIISMSSNDWDDFWKDAPKYLKDEFVSENEEKIEL